MEPSMINHFAESVQMEIASQVCEKGRKLQDDNYESFMKVVRCEKEEPVIDNIVFRIEFGKIAVSNVSIRRKAFVCFKKGCGAITLTSISCESCTHSTDFMSIHDSSSQKEISNEKNQYEVKFGSDTGESCAAKGSENSSEDRDDGEPELPSA